MMTVVWHLCDKLPSQHSTALDTMGSRIQVHRQSPSGCLVMGINLHKVLWGREADPREELCVADAATGEGETVITSIEW